MTVSERGRGAAREYAVVIRGARVVDPSQDLDAARDLALEGGVIAAVGTDLRGRVVLHAAGCATRRAWVGIGCRPSMASPRHSSWRRARSR